jgi:multiple sugar transport system substrate-binding protein
MSKNIKKLLCLTLAVTMTGSLFTACGKKEEKKVATLKEMTSDEVTLTYQFWEDGPVVESLYEEWQKKYPNIQINIQEVTTTDNNGLLMNKMGTSEMPDAFWVLGTPDFAITNGMLANMSAMWAADEDTQNVIGGINEFNLGYLGTEQKWTTPVKFFPTEAWLNMNYFTTHNTDMPSTDWTYEDMLQYAEDLTTGDGSGWGISEAVTVITWYPIASDADCIGEFGWNGTEFDLTNWADGMEDEKSLIDNGYKAPSVIDGTEDQYPQDLGMVAMRLDNWWCWERYWDKQEMYSRNVYWVPYVLPHTEENSSSDTYLATIDFGGIYAGSEYQREAYEILKYFCWGAEGWQYKLSKYDEIVADSVDADGNAVSASGLVAGPINNCPITLDETIWTEYEKKHPTTAAGGDTEGEAMGIDRSPYFDAFFDTVKKSKWTCYGSAQIPGFDTWLADNYNSATLYGEYAGVESAVFDGGEDPADYVDALTSAANQTNQEFIEEIHSFLE